MTDVLTVIKEVGELVREKHLAGQHSQADHAPKKYGKGGSGAKRTVAQVGAEFEGMGFTRFTITNPPGTPPATIMAKVSDGEAATKRRLRKNGYESFKMNGKSVRGVYKKGGVKVSVQPRNFGRRDTRLSITVSE